MVRNYQPSNALKYKLLMINKIALIRPVKDPVRLGSYNIQELGLAKSLLELGVSTDVYLQTNTPKREFRLS